MPPKKKGFIFNISYDVLATSYGLQLVSGFFGFASEIEGVRTHFYHNERSDVMSFKLAAYENEVKDWGSLNLPKVPDAGEYPAFHNPDDLMAYAKKWETK